MAQKDNFNVKIGWRERIFRILNMFREVMIWFTMIYIWTAACLYLYLDINTKSGDACFYGGVSVFVLHILTSPRVVRFWSGGKHDTKR